MTLPEEQSRYVYNGPYSVGNTAPIPFTYDEPEHVKALRGTIPLEINVDYSVMGQNVTMLVPIASAEKLVIYRETPLDNDAEFPQEAGFDSEKINDAIDKLTMQNQEQEEALDRALKLPLDAPTAIKNIDLPLPEANKGLKWNEDGTALVNTKYDTDAIADMAREYAETAIEQAGVATQQAANAAASAELASQKAAETAALAEDAVQEIAEAVADALSETESVKNAAQEAINTAKDSAITDINDAAQGAVASVTEGIDEAKEQAISEVEASGADTIALAQSWAIGDKAERPEGSAKWWAEQTAQLVQGDGYTKLEVDNLLSQKEDNFSINNTLIMSEARVLGVNTTTLEGTFPTKEEVTSEISTALEAKQDKLIAGSGIAIAEDGKTITADMSTVDAYTKAQTNSLLDAKQNKLVAGANITISEENVISSTGGVSDAYTKAETDNLLNGKQNTLVPGTNISITGSTIACTLDTYNRTEIQGLIATKQNALTAGDYITISGNTISATPEDMIKTFDQITWNGMDDSEKNAIKLALIYE